MTINGLAAIYMQLIHGDCLEVLAAMPDCSIDACVTDPPYGLSFMGKAWDYDVPSVKIWREVLRALKPGGHLLSFAGTRTQHRMAVAIEDAGFEIRDMIAWVYGSGFPKSHNLKGGWEGWGTALKPALEPITVARKPLKGTVAANVLEHGTGAINVDGCRVGAAAGDEPLRWEHGRSMGYHGAEDRGPCKALTSPGRWPANLIHDGSDDVVGLFPEAGGGYGKRGAARQMEGWGMGGNNETVGYGDSGSAARFFQQCKGDYDGVWQDLNLPPELASTADSHLSQQRQAVVSALVLAVSSALPEGQHCLGLSMEPSTNATGSELKTLEESVTQAILNIAPRFWHESGLARLSLTSSPVSVVVQKEPTGITTITASHWKSDGSAAPVTYSITPLSLAAGERDSVARFKYCAKTSKADRGPDNIHPTVKPTDLMRYLCRLVTPPSGIVLDPFMGSGSTGKAAMLEGFEFIGIEREQQYLAIAEARINSITELQPELALVA